MPVVDNLALEYQGQIDVVGVAWASTYEDTADVAQRLLPSGATRWLLDEDDSIFGAFEVGYQPAGVLAANGVIVERWPGAMGEQRLREAFNQVLGRTNT